jgi:large subunit ribosomal protein L32
VAVPKKRTSKMKQRLRRTHDKARVPNLSACPRCNEPVLPHRVCGSCGHYRGREIIATGEE